jgi:hypothetical protein
MGTLARLASVCSCANQQAICGLDGPGEELDDEG